MNALASETRRAVPLFRYKTYRLCVASPRERDASGCVASPREQQRRRHPPMTFAANRITLDTSVRLVRPGKNPREAETTHEAASSAAPDRGILRDRRTAGECPDLSEQADPGNRVDLAGRHHG